MDSGCRAGPGAHPGDRCAKHTLTPTVASVAYVTDAREGFGRLEVARPDWANGITAATKANPNDDLHGSASSSDWVRGSHGAAGYNKTFASRANCGGPAVFL